MAQQPYVDLSFGLSQLSGNKDLYLKLLEQFAAEYQNVDEKIQVSMAANKAGEAAMLIHTLKGVSANLGLSALQEQAKRVETDLRQSEQLGEGYPALLECLQATLNEVNALKSEPKSEPTAQNAHSGALQRLRTIVDNMEFIAADELEQILASSGLEEPKRSDIRNAINDLDYFKAKNLIER